MKGQDIRTRLQKIRHILERITDHQMDVKRNGGVGTQRLYNGRAKREIWDEMPIHHIDMQPICTAFFHAGKLLAHARKVTGEDGGRNFYHKRILLKTAENQLLIWSIF